MLTRDISPADVQAYVLRRRPEIGRRIRAARMEKKWTQEGTAIYLGCSRRRMNRVEQGLTNFDIFELELLAQAFGVPITDFLGEG